MFQTPAIKESLNNLLPFISAVYPQLWGCLAAAEGLIQRFLNCWRSISGASIGLAAHCSEVPGLSGISKLLDRQAWQSVQNDATQWKGTVLRDKTVNQLKHDLHKLGIAAIMPMNICG